MLNQSIELKNMYFQYNQNDGYVLTDINVSFIANQITTIVGPSGSGKSTLADIVIGLLEPSKGEICVDNQILNKDLIPAWRQSISYVPQDTFLFHNTIRNNLLWANPDSSEKEMWEALRISCADEFVTNLPQKLNTVIGDRGIRLSGGERQRIALARAILRKPTLLLLDEAMNALDAENENRIKTAIKNLYGKLTIIIISHRISTIQDADKIIILNKGIVSYYGNWDELMGSPNNLLPLLNPDVTIQRRYYIKGQGEN